MLEELRSSLLYNPDTGEFVRIRSMKGRAVGSRVGSRRPDGRVCITFNGGRYLRSRLAWFYVYGRWPEREIDHVNCDYGDDRIVNLREATRSQNLMNTRVRSDNKSGYKGVVWNKKDRKWVASIVIEGKYRYLGGYEKPELAYGAYQNAARKYFGEFARI